MQPFYMNGIRWRVERVSESDPRLTDRTGLARVATTDPLTRTVCIWEGLDGSTLEKVTLHELTHCAMWSFGLLPQIRLLVESGNTILTEEWCCNLIADYGAEIRRAASQSLGYDVWSSDG